MDDRQLDGLLYPDQRPPNYLEPDLSKFLSLLRHVCILRETRQPFFVFPFLNPEPLMNGFTVTGSLVTGKGIRTEEVGAAKNAQSEIARRRGSLRARQDGFADHRLAGLYTLRVHLPVLDERAETVPPQPAPPDAGTKHPNLNSGAFPTAVSSGFCSECPQFRAARYVVKL
jgi:hypothetical protein